MDGVACNLCSSRNDFEIYRDEERKIRVVMCRTCSLAYLNPRPTGTKYQSYYAEEYQKDRHKLEGYDQAVKRLIRKGSYEEKKEYLADFKDFLKPDSRVLEVGSGWGTLLRVIKDHFGCEVSGVEISRLAAEVSRKFYGVKTYEVSFEECLQKIIGSPTSYTSYNQVSERNENINFHFRTNADYTKYNFIIMRHVLEHFLDPLFILSQTKQILSERGFLFLALPNLARPDEPLDRYFRPGHVFYFTPFTIAKMLERAGLKIIKISLHPSEMRVFAARPENPAAAIDTGRFAALYSQERIIKAIRWQDLKYRFLRFLKRGSENFLPQMVVKGIKPPFIELLKKLHVIEI